ncbi:amino acid permease [Lyticum sinuosum]|uniref:Amino acid permease n=1 Tax=Lyticum sinuosum TaxID=1332059 RepID=A0AAE5AH36_9RICK|nr:amino acid permease [Lyticum sinuosum]MDZ5761130.1 putative amino acid permease [Lyticum sinuosum]
MSSFKKFFKKKDINLNPNTNQSEFKRVLGPVDLIMMGIGAIIGAGIFVVTGNAASTVAGPAVILSFLIAGLCCMASGLCYGELSTMIPLSGGAYTYNYVIFGEIAAWLIGSLAVVGYIMVVALVASGWSGYLVSTLESFGFSLDYRFSNPFGSIIKLENGNELIGILNVPATGLVLTTAIVLYFGIELSAIINAIVVTVKMTVLSMFIAIGIFNVDCSNWRPFIPENTGEWGIFGISGILSGAALVLTAFNGYDAVACAAQETKNPQRDLPIGIIGSLIISAITYMLCALVLTGLVNYKDLNVAQPIALAVTKMGMPWFAIIIKLGAVIGLSSVVLITTYVIVRILFAMVEDCLLPKFLGKCHAKYKTPHILTIIVSSLIIIVTNFLELSYLVQLSNICIILITISVCLATILGRKIYPNIKREFKCPGMPIIPGSCIMMLLYLLLTMPDKNVYWQISLVIFFLLVIYIVSINKRKEIK